jgi:hypothetical protein
VREEDDSSEAAWEQPALPRRDTEPDRGQPLCFIGTISVFFAGVSLMMPPLLLASFPLSLTVCLLARGDLEKIENGLMDEDGEALTKRAKDYGLAAVILNVVAVPFSMWIVWMLVRDGHL